MWILTDNKVLVLTLTLQVISELVGGDNSDSQLNQVRHLRDAMLTIILERSF